MESKFTVAGCIYWAALLVYYLAKFSGAPGGLSPSLYGFFPFLVVFILAALGVWRKPKAGYITAVAISAVTLLLAGPNFGIYESPSLEGILAGGATANGILFLTIFFSLIGARETWRKSPVPQKRFRIGRGAAIGALVFLAALIVVGLAFGATLPSTVAGGGQMTVVIAPGAGFVTNQNFYAPSTLHIKAGQTVTWQNTDAAGHTVTANGGLFASGNIDQGKTYSFTFNQAGTFDYTCDYHPWMVGSIVVTSG